MGPKPHRRLVGTKREWPDQSQDLAEQLQRSLAIGDRDWHALKSQRPRRAAEQLAAARSLKNPSDDLSYLLGYFEWMLEGKRDAWHNLVANNSPTQTTHSLAALCYTGGLFPHELLLIEALPMEERPIAILVALSALGDKSAAPALRGKIGPQAAQETVSAYRKLFDRAGFPALNKPHAR